VERAYPVERERSAPSRKHVGRSEPLVRSVETVETAPVKKEAKNENSSISVAAVVGVTETGKVETKAYHSENSSISLASTAVPAKGQVVETAKQATKPVDCKKFFPSVGLTLTVPCE
jgi:hypothetical protein